MIFPHLRSRSTTAVPWEYDDQPASWKLRGLCAEYGVTGDNDPWYSTDPVERMEAVRICQQCPVRAECLADATARGEEHGIWGGVEWLHGRPVDHTRTVGSRKGERRRRRRRDRLAEAESRLDTPEMRALIAAAQAELQPWREALDARIGTCPSCGGRSWDEECRGDCKTVNPNIIKETT